MGRWRQVVGAMAKVYRGDYNEDYSLVGLI